MEAVQSGCCRARMASPFASPATGLTGQPQERQPSAALAGRWIDCPGARFTRGYRAPPPRAGYPPRENVGFWRQRRLPDHLPIRAKMT